MHLAFSSMNTLNDPHPAELARALEDRGFESLWYGEHSHIPSLRATPYPPGGEMHCYSPNYKKTVLADAHQVIALPHIYLGGVAEIYRQVHAADKTRQWAI